MRVTASERSWTQRGGAPLACPVTRSPRSRSLDVALIAGDATVAQLVRAELGRRGHTMLSVAVDRSTVEEGLAERGPDVVLAAAPAPAVADVAVPAAIAAGVPLVDASPGPWHVRQLLEDVDGPAASAGVRIVPAAGTAFLVGDLLGAVAAAAAPGTTEIHVAYSLPRRADLLGGWTRGIRRAMQTALPRGVALVDGELVEERAGEVHRLAWFPRPVGPHHAAGIPGTEALTLPRHVPGLDRVRTYLALPSLAAELLQAGARSLSRTGDAGWASRLLERLPTPDEQRRRAIRWACVAEAPAAGGTARAWAYGTDPYAFAASALVLAAERVVAGGAPAGVVAPGQLGDAEELLDELTLRSGARWSVARP